MTVEQTKFAIGPDSLTNKVFIFIKKYTAGRQNNKYLI